MIRLDALKIQQPCPGDAQIDRDASFCHTCSTRVHDLSAMTERAAQRLLKAHRGQQICISYRRDAHGRPIFASQVEARAWPAIVLGVSLSACTPWGLEAPAPTQPGQDVGECVLLEEGVWACTDDTVAEWVEPAVEPIEEGVAGCGSVQVDYESHVAGGVGGGAIEGEVAAPTRDEPPTGPVVKVDFEIDPDAGHFLRGAVVVTETTHTIGERLKYTPTIDLWRAWKEKRALAKAQRKARRARRARAGTRSP